MSISVTSNQAGLLSENTSNLLASQADRTALAAAFLRITMGVYFLVHAGLKIFVFTPAGTAAFFESIGFPGLLAYAVIGAELFGGIALILGFYSRYVALTLVPVMLGATYTHFGSGFIFSNEGGGWEFPAMWTVALIVQALLGNGKWALSKD